MLILLAFFNLYGVYHEKVFFAGFFVCGAFHCQAKGRNLLIKVLYKMILSSDRIFFHSDKTIK